MNINVLGVDPNPNVFNKVPIHIYEDCVKPCTNNLDSGELDEHIGKNFLLISWSNPNGPSLPTKSYDVHALEKMKPLGFYITYGPCGCAGSTQLIDLLEFGNDSSDPLQFLNVDIKNPKTIIQIGEYNYYLVKCYTYTIGSGSGFTGKTFRSVSYVRQDVKRTDNNPEFEESSDKSYNTNDSKNLQNKFNSPWSSEFYDRVIGESHDNCVIM